MFNLKTSTSEPITPELVDRFKTMTPSVTERPLSAKRVNFLIDQVTKGLAIPFIWVSALHNGKEYRLNGQHSSTALTLMNGNMPSGLVAHLDQYEIETLEELPNIFQQYDARGSTRSLGDIAGAWASINHELDDLPRPELKVGIEAIHWYRRTVEGIPAKKGDDVYESLNDPAHNDFLKWVSGVLTIKTPELKPHAVLGAMYSTYNVHPNKADEFWKEVALGGDSLSETQPQRVLDLWLRRLKEDKNYNLSPAQCYQGCVFAWNAFIEHKMVKTIYFDAKKGFLNPAYPE